MVDRTAMPESVLGQLPLKSAFDKGRYYIEDADGNVILDGPYLCEAERAVRCVNSHQALVDALKELLAKSYTAAIPEGDADLQASRLAGYAALKAAGEL